MLTIAGDHFPASTAELARGLEAGLARSGISPAKVTVEGATWPAIDALTLDLSGAALTRDVRFGKAAGHGAEGVTAGRFELIAEPVEFEGVRARVAIRGNSVAFAFARDDAGGVMLTPVTAADGTATIEIARAEIESALNRLASEAARKQGFEVKSVSVRLDSRGPRSLAFSAEVAAKMFVMKAAVTLGGELSVDDELNAQLTNLRVTGEGMIGAMANSFAAPWLKKWDGRSFPLLALSLGDLKLREIELSGGESLRLNAKFGTG